MVYLKGGVDAQSQVGRQAGMQETENGNNHKSDNKAEQNFSAKFGERCVSENNGNIDDSGGLGTGAPAVKVM